MNGKNIQGLTPLYRAVYEGKVGLTHLLLQYGADVEARDNNGETALHLAARKNHSEIAALLFEHGANANAENIKDLTPLSYKPAVLGPYRFTHAQLEREGIIVESNVPDTRYVIDAV